jgi:triosephosphate isomerase
MAGPRTPLIAGNWKMNGLSPALAEVIKLKGMIKDTGGVDVVVCPPFTLLEQISDAGIATGGQDCHSKASGAFTGDISAEMLADAGARYVIVGHSERRVGHGEDDALVRAKAEAGLRAGLVPIVCIGETLDERRGGQANYVVERQILGSTPDLTADQQCVIAYEPVWAIGTGVTPTNEEIAQMHGFIRKLLTNRFKERGDMIRILYGGSLKPSNAKEILAIPDVDGGLVGGASLLADDFAAIISAAV